MAKEEKFDIKTLKKIPLEECFICNRKINPKEIIYEDENFIAFLDGFPPTKGYTILAFKKHIEDITEMSEEDYAEMQRLLHQISLAIKKAFKTKRICVLNSGGLLSHFHFHIIPVYTEVYNNFIDIILKKTILHFTLEEKKKIVEDIRENLK